jgi:hypothetical protein
VLAAGTFYVICMVAQSLGFGLSDAGIKRFSESSGPLGDLGKNYIGSGFADVINFGATMSAFAAALGAATAASRILFAIARDGFPRQRAGSCVGALRRPGWRAHGDPRRLAHRDGGLPDQRHERGQRVLLSRHHGRAADAGQLLRLQHRRDRLPLLRWGAARAAGRDRGPADRARDHRLRPLPEHARRQPRVAVHQVFRWWSAHGCCLAS